MATEFQNAINLSGSAIGVSYQNKFLGENHFEIDPKVFAKYQLISKIKYVVHSHYMQNCKPSQHDKNVAKVLGIPFLIVSYPEKGVEIYDPR